MTINFAEKTATTSSSRGRPMPSLLTILSNLQSNGSLGSTQTDQEFVLWVCAVLLALITVAGTVERILDNRHWRSYSDEQE